METWDVIKFAENLGYHHVFENAEIIVFRGSNNMNVGYIKSKHQFVRKMGATKKEVDKLNELLP